MLSLGDFSGGGSGDGLPATSRAYGAPQKKRPAGISAPLRLSAFIWQSTFRLRGLTNFLFISMAFAYRAISKLNLAAQTSYFCRRCEQRNINWNLAELRSATELSLHPAIYLVICLIPTAYRSGVCLPGIPTLVIAIDMRAANRRGRLHCIHWLALARHSTVVDMNTRP